MKAIIIVTILLLILSPIIIGMVIDMMDSADSNTLEEFLFNNKDKSITGEESKNLYEDTECKDSKTNIPEDE